MSIKINKNNFKSEVLECAVPVLVDFWADWCGACKLIDPMIKQLSEDIDGKAKVCTIDVQKETELAKQFDIISIPTIMVFKDGEMMNKIVGFRDKNDLRGLLGV